MKKVFVLSILFVLLSACGGEKNKSMTGEDEVTIQDFFDFFPVLILPANFSDSVLSKKTKENDSLLIGHQVYYQFIPDSLIKKVFDAKAQPKIYSVGKFGKEKEELYLLTKVLGSNKKAIFITVFDKDNNYIAGQPLVIHGVNDPINAKVTIDSRFNINKSVIKRLSNGMEVKGNDVYALNAAAKAFMLIMTDSLGEAVTELVNPIDTLPKTFKYAGDYGQGKLILISIRDGQREGRVNFFLHLEKNNKNCVGELKGEAVFTSTNVAEYRQGGDPCVLQFIFNNNGVTLKELEGCGSRMGSLDCTFDGVYPKRKAAKKPEKKEEIVARPKPKKK
ncbi:MAG: hypothetical protein IPH58_12940 [Sphingobacteriales bacterium]|nr:hypothetical protein [Sphingobacteriales bacterium]